MFEEIKEYYYLSGNIQRHYFVDNKNRKQGYCKSFSDEGGKLYAAYNYKNDMWHNVNKIFEKICFMIMNI